MTQLAEESCIYMAEISRYLSLLFGSKIEFYSACYYQYQYRLTFILIFVEFITCSSKVSMTFSISFPVLNFFPWCSSQVETVISPLEMQNRTDTNPRGIASSKSITILSASQVRLKLINQRIKDDNFGFAVICCLVIVRRVHIWSSGCRPCRYHYNTNTGFWR